MHNKKPILGVFIVIINGTVQPALARPEVPESVQKIYQAARNYDDPALKQQLCQTPRGGRTKALFDAKEYAIAVSDAQTTRNLTEKWLDSQKNMFQRHPYLTCTIVPFVIAFTCTALGEKLGILHIPTN